MTKPKCSLRNRKTTEKSKSALLHELVKQAAEGDYDAIEKLDEITAQDPVKKTAVDKLFKDYEFSKN